MGRGDGACALCGFGQATLAIGGRRLEAAFQQQLLAEPAPDGRLVASAQIVDDLTLRGTANVIAQRSADGALAVPVDPPFPCPVFVVTAEPGHETSLLLGVRRTLEDAQALWGERATEAARRRHRAVAPFEWTDIGEEPDTAWLTSTDDADGVAGCIERVKLP